MNRKQVEGLIVEYINGFFVLNEFKYKGSIKSQVEYYRIIKNNGFERFSLSTINYGESHKLRFGFGKRIDSVEEILDKVNESNPLTNPPQRKSETTLGFSYNSYKGVHKDGCFDYMESVEHVKSNAKRIVEFSEKGALPFLTRLNDIREIDKLINGNGEKFWESDWNMRFNLAGRFVFRRVIIAKLSGRKDYDLFIETLKDNADRKAKESNKVIDWEDKSIGLVYLISYLNEIEPLY